MSDNKWVYRVSDGQFCFGVGPDPAIYLTDPVNFGVADIGAGTPRPDPRTQRWDGTAVVSKSAEVIAAVKLSDQFAPLRTERTALLTVSDWTHMSDVTLSAETLDTWAVYRQALRDLPATTDDPAQVIWPTPPPS